MNKSKYISPVLLISILYFLAAPRYTNDDLPALLGLSRSQYFRVRNLLYDLGVKVGQLTGPGKGLLHIVNWGIFDRVRVLEAYRVLKS